MPRSWFGRSWQRAGLALAIYTLLALALTWPLAAHFTTHVTGDGIDDPALAWNLWWVKLRLVDQLNLDLFHSGWMFHPVDINLAFYTLTPLNGLLSIPLQLVFGLTVATNLLLLASFILGGFGTYLLVRQLLQLWSWDDDAYLVPGYIAALLAGGIFAFASAKLFYAALGQFNIASSQWIPFCALYLVRMVQAPSQAPRLRGKFREAAFAGLFLVFQAWAELTYASFLLLLIGLLFLWAMLFGRGWRGRLHDTAAFLLVGAIFVLGLLPFLGAMAPDLAAEGDFFSRGGGFADVFSADLLGYLMPTRLHPWLGTWVTGLPFPNDKGQQIFLGYSVLLLALLGAWGLWRGGSDRRSNSSPPANAATTRRWLLFWGAAAVLFLLLTLGPQLRWAGQSLPLPGPFALVNRLPFFSGNRYPSRYSVMLLLAVAVLAGAGTWWLLARAWVRTHKGWAAAALGGIACLVLLEHLSIPLPLSSQQIPAIYSRLAAEARTNAAANAAATGALLELPTGWRNGARVLGKSDLLIMAQQLYQTEHGLRRLGGNTSRNPEFKFQYFTDAPLLGDLIALFNADQPHIAPVIDSELDAMITRNRPLAARVLDFLGIHYVTVDVEKSPAALLHFVDEALPLALLAEETGVRSDGTAQTTRLYTVEPSPAETTTQRIAVDDPLVNLYLGEGWSPGAGAPVRYAVRPQPTLLVNVPTPGARVLLDWTAPLANLAATVNGRTVAAAAIDAEGLRWALDVPAGVGDRPVDHVVLQLPAPGVAAGELSVPPNGQGWPVGTTGVALAPGSSLLVRSAGQETGDFAHIWLNGIDVAGGERGYNLVALDATGKLLGQAVFDTLASAGASAALAAWLRSWPQGTIIAGAVRDEASLKLGQDAVDALKEVGVATDLRSHFRWSHAFAGATGAAPGTALEDANLLRPAVVAVGPAVNGPRAFGQLQALEIDQTGFKTK